MTNYFVTRHAGAIEWARSQGIQAKIMKHLEIEDIEGGDMVLGTLPVHIIAALNEKNVRYLHLILDIPFADRGRELSADDMEQMGARLEEYWVKKVGNNEHKPN